MLKAADLVRVSTEEIWDYPNGPMKLQFEDGVIETTMRRTVFSHYIWEIHRHYPLTPVKMSHHIGNRILGSSTHLDLLSNAVWDCYFTYKAAKKMIDLEHLSYLVRKVDNMLYNDMSTKIEEYVSSISILDFLDVLDHPLIAEANSKVRPNWQTTEHTIEKTYDVITKVLKDPNELKGNAVAIAARSGMVSMGQILQCVGPRGNATDIDSHIFRNPILRGFAQGFTSLEDMMKESRSAAKALMFTKDPMAKSEYFNRNIQLSAATLKNLHQVDCGSTDYIPFYVKPGDLADLEGIHYWDEKAKELKTVTTKDKHLIGNAIQMRSVFTCKHPDRLGICVKCFGETGLSFPADTNVGHFSSTELQAAVSQRILSTKHEDGSATLEDMVLSDYEKRFIKIGSSPHHLMIADHLAGTKFSLQIYEEEAQRLTDLTYLKDISEVRKLIPIRISEISSVMFVITRGDKTEISPVNVSMGTRMSSLTWQALEYIKRVGWQTTIDGRYEIDMSEWNKKDVLFELPLKHFSTVDYMKSIESFIKGNSRRGVQSLMDFTEPSAALMAFHELVSSKLKVNISHLQTIILSTMVQNLEERDHNLPMPRHKGQFSPYSKNMAHRSLSAMMAYQGQAAAIFSPPAYIIRSRPPHPLDYLLLG